MHVSDVGGSEDDNFEEKPAVIYNKHCYHIRINVEGVQKGHLWHVILLHFSLHI